MNLPKGLFKSSLRDKPWRDVPWGDKKDYNYVKGYKPHSKVQHVRILLLGLPASGKSSFINSIESTLRGRFGSRALAATGFDESFTEEYRSYKINSEVPGVHHPLVFSDTMGVESGVGNGIDVKNIKLIMKGHIKEGCKLFPSSDLNEAYYNENPTITDKVHVLVCVVDAAKAHMMPPDVAWKIREVRKAARTLGIPQIAILTKIDEACPKIKKDIKNVYKSKHLEKQMEHVSADLTIPMNCIFPVKNYSKENKLDDNIDTLLMNAMRVIIDYGEDFLNDYVSSMNPQVPLKDFVKAEASHSEGHLHASHYTVTLKRTETQTGTFTCINGPTDDTDKLEQTN